MAFLSSQMQIAAATSSSAQDPLARSAAGTPDVDAKWITLQGRLARALVSNPDISFWFIFLCSNKARVAVLAMAAQLELMIQYAEGAAIPQKPVSAKAATRATSTVAQLATALSEPAGASTALLDHVQTDVQNYAASILPSIKTGTRLQPKGSEASAKYNQARQYVQSQWTQLLYLLDQCSQSHMFSVPPVQQIALRTPTSNLSATLAVPFDPAKASNLFLQTVASASAVDAMARPFDPHLRMATNLFPAGVSVEDLTDFGGFLTGFTPSISLQKLGIKVGDSVVGGNGTASVVSASTVITLKDSTIPLGTTNLRVLPYAQTAYASMVATDMTATLPSTGELQQALARLENPSAAATRDLCTFLGAACANLSTLSAAATASLVRQGADIPVVASTIASILLEYAPPFDGLTTQAGRATLDALKNEGFTRAESLLIEGRIDQFFMLPDAASASFIGITAAAAAELNEEIGPHVPSANRNTL